MPAESNAYGGLFRFEQPRHGQFLSSIGTSVVVLNTSTASVTGGSSGASRDIYDILDGTATNDEKCRRVSVPKDYAYLDLYHVWTDTGAGNGCTTAPTVRVFGRKPLWVPNSPVSSGAGRKWPQDLSPDNYPDVMASAFGDAKGFWVPLVKPDWQAGIPEIAFDTNDPIRCPSFGGVKALHVSEPQSVFLSGCEEVVVAIDTAASYSDSGVGLILGCFVS